MYLSVGKVTANYWLILPFVVFSSPISVVVEVFAAVVVKMFSIFLLSDKKKTTKFKKRNCRKMVSVIKFLHYLKICVLCCNGTDQLCTSIPTGI